jgi:hypothetical protein
MQTLNDQNRKTEKVEIVVKMFKFLSKTQIINNFIVKNDRFKQTVILKALEFKEEIEFPEVVEICIRFLKKMGYDENRVD